MDRARSKISYSIRQESAKFKKKREGKGGVLFKKSIWSMTNRTWISSLSVTLGSPRLEGGHHLGSMALVIRSPGWPPAKHLTWTRS